MDYEQAKTFWTRKQADAVPCPDARGALEEFLSAHRVCALATGADDYVRCTPLEYTWLDGAFWIFTEGGMKFAGLQSNSNVSVAVFDASPEFGGLHSAQIQGTASVVEPFSADYLRLLEFKHIGEDAIRALPEPLYLLQIVPTEADFLNSDFKGQGFDSRQHVMFR